MMTTSNSIETNKAKIIFKNNNLVEKEWFNKKLFKIEVKNLLNLNQIFDYKMDDKWVYTSVKIRKVDYLNLKVTMDKAPGKIADFYIGEKKEKIYHMCKWLGFYHNISKVDVDKVKIYGDFSRMNFLIDSDKKIATSIDPGEYYGKISYPEYDIIIGLYSLLIGSIRKKQLPFKTFNYFISGYNKSFDSKISETNMIDSIEEVKTHLKSNYEDVCRLKRFMMFIQIEIILKIIERYIKITLERKE